MPHPEALGLDRDTLLRMADAHAGYAAVLRASERSEQSPWVASSLLLAAAYRALVDPARAREEFYEAAWMYLWLDAPLAGVLAVCAGSEELIREFVETAARGRVGDAGPIQRMGLVVARRWLVESDTPLAELDLAGDKRAGTRFLFAPAGRLGVPVVRYGHAFDEVARAAERGRDVADERVPAGPNVADRVLPSFAELLERAAETTYAAMTDDFHWRRARSAVLPVEPEMVAACRCVLRIWSRRGRTLRDLFAIVAHDKVDPVAVFPLEVAADLDEGEDHGRGTAGSPDEVVGGGTSVGAADDEAMDRVLGAREDDDVFA